MSDPGRLILHDREGHLYVDADTPLKVGDTVEVIRGNGPRECAHMGTATVAGFEENGSPILDVHFGNGG